MTAVAAEAAVVVDNGRETSGETSLWHGAAAGAAARSSSSSRLCVTQAYS